MRGAHTENLFNVSVISGVWVCVIKFQDYSGKVLIDPTGIDRDSLSRHKKLAYLF